MFNKRIKFFKNRTLIFSLTFFIFIYSDNISIKADEYQIPKLYAGIAKEICNDCRNNLLKVNYDLIDLNNSYLNYLVSKNIEEKHKKQVEKNKCKNKYLKKTAICRQAIKLSYNDKNKAIGNLGNDKYEELANKYDYLKCCHLNDKIFSSNCCATFISIVLLSCDLKDVNEEFNNLKGSYNALELSNQLKESDLFDSYKNLSIDEFKPGDIIFINRQEIDETKHNHIFIWIGNNTLNKLIKQNTDNNIIEASYSDDFSRSSAPTINNINNINMNYPYIVYRYNNIK